MPPLFSHSSLTAPQAINNRSIGKLIGKLRVCCSTTLDRAEAAQAAQQSKKKQKRGAKKEAADTCCEWEGALDKEPAHLLECAFAFVQCGWDSCDTSVQRQELDTHESECRHRLVPCEHCEEGWCGWQQAHSRTRMCGSCNIF